MKDNTLNFRPLTHYTIITVLIFIIFSTPGALSRFFFFNSTSLNISLDIAFLSILIGSRTGKRTFWLGIIGGFTLFDLWIFLPPGVTLSNIAHEGLLSVSSISGYYIYIAISLLSLIAIYKIPSVRQSKEFVATLFCILTLISLVCWVATGSNYLRSATYFAIKDSNFLFSKINGEFNTLAGKKTNSPVNSIIDGLKHSNLIVIVTESLGLPTANWSSVMEKELATLDSYRNCTHKRSSSVVGTRRFTITSEILYLCSLDVQGFSVDLSNERCTPSLWGAHSYAYHNNNLSFYNRSSFYRDAGFKHVFGKSQMKLDSDSTIPFQAPSDKKVADFIEKNATTHGGIHYWMTIDLHSPYKRSDMPSLSPIETYNVIRKRNLETFGEMISKLPNFTFIVTGDHNPKFFSKITSKFQDRTSPLYLIGACDKEMK